MTAVDAMAAWGIVDPDAVSDVAAHTGLPLALACALLEQESGGGRNVWGHDGGAAVRTGGVYVPGAEVTAAAYRSYRRLADSGVINRQGVGPCQLTAKVWQDAADGRGGCWDPNANMLAAFTGLVTMINKYGLPDGVRRYNGSGPAAEHYRDQVLTRYRAWTDRLGTSTHLEGDDMPLTQADADLVVRTLLATPLRDLYPDVPVRDITVGETLQWAAANSGRALTTVARLRTDLGVQK